MKLRRASYRRRAIAFGVDLGCLFSVYAIGSLAADELGLSSDRVYLEALRFSALNLAFLIYLAFTEASSWQASLGKLALGLRVVDRAGLRCSLFQIVTRNGVKLFTVAWLTALVFRVQDINQLLLVAILFSISSNPIWHNFMAVAVPETHGHGLVHDRVGRTVVVAK